MLKFIFGILTEPLGLPIEWYWEYIILAIIGAAAFAIAYHFVGDLYDSGDISGSGIGSIIHWVIRIVAFVIIWAITYGVIATVKWLTANWVIVLCIFGAAVVLMGTIAAIISIVRKRKKRIVNGGDNECVK